MEFFKSIIIYWREAPFDSFTFWMIPLITVISIWILTIAGVKIVNRKNEFKTIFLIHRAWIVSSLITAGIIIGTICYLWIQNYFAQNSYQLAALLSLLIAMIIPIITFVHLKKYYASEQLKEIVDQPKTSQQLYKAISLIYKGFRKNKFYYILPLLGFLLLLFHLNKGTNLITIVFDNSGSMEHSNTIEALSITFKNLETNNQIYLSTLDGYSEDNIAFAKRTMEEIMQQTTSSSLIAGQIMGFQTPEEAANSLYQLSATSFGSPICEGIWKTFLHLQENSSNETYKQRLLIILTDGEDNFVEERVSTGTFFFDNEKFQNFFEPENIFIIDYSNGKINPFIQRFMDNGTDIYPAENNIQDYLDGLDNALSSFKNNYHLIYWTILIYGVLCLIGLLISPKKII